MRHSAHEIKCPNGDLPEQPHLFEAAAGEGTPLFMFCRNCGEVRKIELPAAEPIPLDDLPSHLWPSMAQEEQRRPGQRERQEEGTEEEELGAASSLAATASATTTKTPRLFSRPRPR